MIVEGQFQFDKEFPGVVWTDIDITVDPDVKLLAESKKIEVNIVFTVKGDLTGSFAPNINPVPVIDLNYNYDQLVDRVVDRLQDFKV